MVTASSGSWSRSGGAVGRWLKVAAGRCRRVGAEDRAVARWLSFRPGTSYLGDARVVLGGAATGFGFRVRV